VTDAKNRLHPRPHQITAIAAITRALTVGNRTHLISACGTGKTLTGRWYA
jgi:predicted helicase